MLSVKPISIGDIEGSILEFECAGDLLPAHVHSENDIHISIIVRGTVRAFSHDWEKVCHSGDIIDFQSNQPHALEALDDNVKVINILKKQPSNR